MKRRSLPPVCHSWLTTIVCCVMALLTAGEPARPFHLAVQRLLETTSSERTEDEESEPGKVTAASMAARRSFRRRSSSVPGRSKAIVLSSCFGSLPQSMSLPLSPPSGGEIAFRNGVGAPLRC
jgi:hypothetical protein